MPKKKPILPKTENVSAGIGGAAGGSGIIGVVGTLKLSPEVQQAIFLVTPWISLVLTLLLNFILKKIKFIQQERLINQQLKKAKIHRDEILNDSNSSDEEREEVSKWYSSLMQYKWEFHESILDSLSKDFEAPKVVIK